MIPVRCTSSSRTVIRMARPEVEADPLQPVIGSYAGKMACRAVRADYGLISLWNHARSLRAFRARLNIESDFLTFVQGLETFGLDGRKMYEDVITAIILCEKAKTLGLVEPLDCSCSHVYLYVLLSRFQNTAVSER